jgi:dTDP-4-dehydrorhamnose reductase
MKKTILITGANGMLGQDATRLFLDSGFDVLKAKKGDLDVTNLAQVQEFFAKNKIDFVLHAAAYTKVDDAEDNRELAFLINAEGAKNVAIATNEKAIPIIYISTDYVFDGEKGAPYLTSDKANPINVYGASKLAGEEAVKQINPKHYIARTSWLYGKNGKNFVDTMIALSKTQKSLKVVNDQFGCPTWTVDLAEGAKNLITKNLPFGTYNLCGAGVASWFEFAKKIFEILKIEIEVIPVATTEFLRPAKRPKFSAMENNDALGEWELGLKNYLESVIQNLKN